MDSEEEVDEEEADGLAELPQKRKPVKSETKRMSKLSSLFDKGNKVSVSSIDRFSMIDLYDSISHLFSFSLLLSI